MLQAQFLADRFEAAAQFRLDVDRAEFGRTSPFLRPSAKRSAVASDRHTTAAFE
jgi:hypothetical protein